MSRGLTDKEIACMGIILIIIYFVLFMGAGFLLPSQAQGLIIGLVAGFIGTAGGIAAVKQDW